MEKKQKKLFWSCMTWKERLGTLVLFVAAAAVNARRSLRNTRETNFPSSIVEERFVHLRYLCSNKVLLLKSERVHDIVSTASKFSRET